MAIQKTVEKLDREIVALEAEYCRLNEKFNHYRGKILEKEDEVKINKLLHDMQTTFGELYKAYHFIQYRYESSINFCQAYREFIDSLIKSGAVLVDNQEQ